MKKLQVALFGIVFLIAIFSQSKIIFAADSQVDSPVSKIKIIEVKPGGSGFKKQYVSLYNETDSSVSLDGWALEYAKEDFLSDNCDSASWDEADTEANASKLELAGLLSANSVSLPIDISITDNKSGSIRITDNNSVVHDLIGWGSAAPCFDIAPADQPSSSTTTGQSLVRYIDCDTFKPIDTDNNSQDFGVTDSPSPGLINSLLHPDCMGVSGGSGSGSDQSQIDNSCSGLVISEVLPNPSGADSGNEFIELYNPTKNPISLKGCSLEVGSNSYKFNDNSVKNGTYKAFYDDLTGLNLPNSSGGTIYLLDADNTELDKVSYQANLDDDVSWVLSNYTRKWSISYASTPNTENEIVTVEPCPSGQIRNQETNRCNNIISDSSLSKCPSGKVRNPDTNRCRNILSAVSALTPCKTGQARNPETNRCKSILASSSSLKPCAANQERNPETNRCRKVGATLNASDSKVKDVISEVESDSPMSWFAAGFSAVGAIGYAFWEWRNEFFEKLSAIKSKFKIV